jgi:hypothetical protein
MKGGYSPESINQNVAVYEALSAVIGDSEIYSDINGLNFEVGTVAELSSLNRKA